MSWSPVATAHSDVQGILNHIPPPSLTLRSRDPTIEGAVEQGSDTTDVSPPSCPLSRASSAARSIHRGHFRLGSEQHFLSFLRCYDFTTSSYSCGLCNLFERFFDFHRGVISLDTRNYKPRALRSDSILATNHFSGHYHHV